MTEHTPKNDTIISRRSCAARRWLQAAQTATSVAIAIAICGLLPVKDAAARTVCGKKIHTKYGETRARFKATLATVRPDGSAHAVIYRAARSAPLGWSHSLRVWRPHHNSNWKLQLVAVERMADINQPFWLSVGNTPPITFEKPHIQTHQSVNEYDLTSETGQMEQILDELRAGRSVEWRYVDQSGRDATARFSLSGLTAANRWLECAAGGE